MGVPSCVLATEPHLSLLASYEEAGRYLETYKAYENKPPDLLMERVDSDSSSRVSGGSPSPLARGLHL